MNIAFFIKEEVFVKISLEYFNEYKEEVLEEMIKQGATENELQLVKEGAIINGIRNNRKPEDVAWAILQ